MKRLMIMCVVVLFAIGCGGKKGKLPNDVGYIDACLKDGPSWVKNYAGDTPTSAVGSAEIGRSGSRDYAVRLAETRARVGMASAISVKVDNMMKDFIQETGIGDQAVVDSVNATVTRQITSQTLEGTKRVAFWQSQCDEVFVLMDIEPALVGNQVNDIIKSSYRNDNALWQQFQAQKAQDELDSAIRAQFYND